MFGYLVDAYLSPLGPAAFEPVVETPSLGCLHPARKGYFDSPADYLKWWVSCATVRLDRLKFAAPSSLNS